MNTSGNTLHFLKQHWFKFVLIGILLVIYFKKEISLGINFNTPKQAAKQAQTAEPELATSTEEKAATTTPTEKTDETPQVEQMSIKDKLNALPFWRTDKQDSPDALPDVPIEVLDEYINRFARLARGEKEKHGVPAAIVLASAMLQSQLGQNSLSQSAHNHFRLKCTEDWKGELSWHQGQCYRVYDKAWTSFRDYSLFLTTGANAKLAALSPTDYKAWADAIEASDFFEQKQLSKKLLQIIEKYNLQQLDV